MTTKLLSRQQKRIARIFVVPMIGNVFLGMLLLGYLLNVAYISRR